MTDDQKSIRQSLARLKYDHTMSSSSTTTKEQMMLENSFIDVETFHELYDQLASYRKAILNEKCILNSRMIYKGLEHMRFLMECLPPASLPDVPFMSALLELDAPVLSKAAFLLELAYFVNRCNRKDWPEWIKMNISIFRPYGSMTSNKNLPNMVKRNRVYQLAAANVFAAWAEVLANKFESFLDSRTGPICEPSFRPEDYFDDRKYLFKSRLLFFL